MTKYVSDITVAAFDKRPLPYEDVRRFSDLFSERLPDEIGRAGLTAVVRIYPLAAAVKNTDELYTSLKLSFFAAYIFKEDLSLAVEAVISALNYAAAETGLAIESAEALRNAVNEQLFPSAGAEKQCFLRSFFRPKSKPMAISRINGVHDDLFCNDKPDNQNVVKFGGAWDEVILTEESSADIYFHDRGPEDYALANDIPEALEPDNELINKLRERLTYKQHRRLSWLYGQISESLSRFREFHGVVSLMLQEDLLSGGIVPGLCSSDKDNVNIIAKTVSSAIGKPCVDCCFLKKAVRLIDLERLLAASVGNMLLIYCHGEDGYDKFLLNREVTGLLREFRHAVQIVILYYPSYGNKKVRADLLKGLGVTEKGDADLLIDLGSMDVKEYKNAEYLKALLSKHERDPKLIDLFIERYDKQIADELQVITDFSDFKSEQFYLTLLQESKKLDGDPNKKAEFNTLKAALANYKPDRPVYEFSYSRNWDKELDGLIGLEKAKQQLRKLKKLFDSRYIRGKTNDGSKRVFTFEGDPGCGKTMVARYFAYSLKQSGLISAAEPFHDVRISELVGTHIGEAAAQTDQIFRDYSRSVIFIDEAYGLLDEGQYGRSAINQIVKNISSMHDETVLILAGYPSDIGRLLKENPGLESRITERIQFDNYSCDELIGILNMNLLSRCGLTFEKREDEKEPSVINNYIREFLLEISACGEEDTGRTLGNARFIDNLITKLEIAHAEALPEDPEKTAPEADLDTVTLETVERALQALRTEFKKTGSTNGSRRSTYYTPTRDTDTFDRIIGNKNAIEQLKLQLEIFKNPEKYSKVTEGTRGILLTGDPGCGKTLLARAMAHSVKGTAFLCANGTDFIKKYSGEGADKLQELFDEIETYEKCILFIDEIDAIGRSRSAGGDASSLENQALMKLLTCLDGFKRRGNFLIIAATNTPDTLDPALQRRLGTRISVELPNHDERLIMLKRFLEDLSDDSSIPEDKLKELADHETIGFSGDQINKCTKEAYITAVSSDQPISFEILQAAIRKVTVGFNGNIRLTPEEKKLTAYHEIGHAFTARHYGMEVRNVSIIPNDRGSLGYTISPPDTSNTLTKSALKNRICVLLGGRAAEELFSETNTASTGCSEDLDRATSIAVNMVTRFGMGKKLRVRQPDDPEALREADNILDECYERVKELLKSNEGAVRELAAALADKGSLSEEEIMNILK